MLIPKSLDRTVAYTATNLFPAEWLAAADDAAVPDEATPRCAAPGAGAVGWPYRRFRSNYERVAAQELAKQRDPDPAAGFARRGFLLQAVAAGWHRKSAAQLRAVGDAVGRARIAVVHGTADRVISVPHGRSLIGYLEPGRGLVVDGMGHVPLMERTEWFNGLLAEMCATGERLSGR
ncbi:putative glycylpeptide N-tetradecanoyltransferase [Rosellinia necatrix]|uniref:Putative glycylpeptide N-tetradecanoyltransferase n=1 Tax=Rosellinia necatrix TaxID=77044 RepID=A0A1W2TIT5_ROSNE|nr:putative glycylpeptide N-tetradecanoyltransferase [Rosellinia necatrix]